MSRIGTEKLGSQTCIPPDHKDDRALQEALAVLRGTVTNAAPSPPPQQATR